MNNYSAQRKLNFLRSTRFVHLSLLLLLLLPLLYRVSDTIRYDTIQYASRTHARTRVRATASVYKDIKYQRGNERE